MRRRPAKYFFKNKHLRIDFREVFSRGFVQILNRPPSRSEVEVFSRYLALLLQWNRAHPLTGYKRPGDIAEKLFLDSLFFLRWLPPGGLRVLDLGAGAGIPGLPLKIVEPAIRLTLLEARRRRVSFLSAVVRDLRLEGVSILAGRAESLIVSDPELRGSFDAVVTRAVGPPGSILPVALAFLRLGGRFIASGPPAGKPLPLLPPGTPHRWEAVPTPGRTRRRFLIVEKS